MTRSSLHHSGAVRLLQWGALFYTALIMMGFTYVPPQTGSPATPDKITVDRGPVSSPEQLVRSSDLIVHGQLSESVRSFPTGLHEGSRRVFHYVQTVRITELWKGSAAGNTVSLLTSGVEPLPDASDPLNRTYTGPLESGEYVFFLHRAGNTRYYTLTGIWQGLYPVYGGSSIALLHNGGFAAFDRLPLASMKAKITRMLH
jgi:hypothetical protein